MSRQQLVLITYNNGEKESRKEGERVKNEIRG